MLDFGYYNMDCMDVMKQFDWKKFERTMSNIAVHCKTEEEAEDFCKKMHEHGMEWSSGSTYLKRTNFDLYFDRMCYYSDGQFSDLKYAERNRYTILEWSDYMQTEFTKADLKDGMVVEERNKRKYIVLGDRVLNNKSYNRLEGYGNDLTDTQIHNREFDIIRVFKVKNNFVTSLEHLFKDENLELIWERTETKRMTIEEIRKKLEELTGEKIEVEPNRDEMVGICYNYCSGISDEHCGKDCCLDGSGSC